MCPVLKRRKALRLSIKVGKAAERLVGQRLQPTHPDLCLRTLSAPVHPLRCQSDQLHLGKCYKNLLGLLTAAG